MRIGDLAQSVGVSADTIRFYERAGSLPRVGRGANGYRDYSTADAEHLRMLIALRRLGIPLGEAATLARSCHSGHCEDTTASLPDTIARQRQEIAARIAALRVLDERLGTLERHVRRELPVAGATSACCAAVGLVVDGCGCCAAEG